MGRIIGIDFGTKRIGLAVTDPLQIFASPLDTIRNEDFFTFVEEYRKKETIEAFVVGNPVQLNNKPSESVNQLTPFLKKLGNKYPEITIHLIDERFTSQMALRSMIDGGVSKKDRRDKMMVDRISASIILQSFLDKRSNTVKKE